MDNLQIDINDIITAYNEQITQLTQQVTMAKAENAALKRRLDTLDNLAPDTPPDQTE